MPEQLRPFVLDPATGTPPSRRHAPDRLDLGLVRQCIRQGRKLRLDYADEQGRATERIVWPVALGFLETSRVIAAWCELRQDFRHFRTDRVRAADFLDDRYPARPAALRAQWRKSLARPAAASPPA